MKNTTVNHVNGINIPSEIIDFLSKPGGRSLIVRGGPGTGKTTFALELTTSLKEDFTTYYVTSRLDDKTLFEHFPWLEGKAFIDRKTPFDKSLIGMDGKGEHVSPKKREPGSVDRTELDKLEARVEAGEEFFDDDDIQEKETASVENGGLIFDLAMVLPEIDLVYEIVERSLPKKSLIIVDSIEALSEKYGISSKKLIYTLQKDLVENSKTNVVFILEKGATSNLEFLADGVLDFGMSEYAGRRIRTLRIMKLRGVPIKDPKRLFTLLGGRFTFFGDHLVHNEFQMANETIQNTDDQNMFGIPDLDSLVGGFREASINLIELGEGVETRIIDSLIAKLVVNSISKNKGTYVLPPERVEISNIERKIKEYELTNKALRFIEVAEMGDSVTTPTTISIEGDSIRDDLRWDVINHSLSGTESPYMFIAGFDTLNSIYGRDSYLGLVRHLSILLKNRGTFFGFGWSSDEDTVKFSNYAHTHLKIEYIDGTPVLFGERPYTNIHYLSLSQDSKSSEDKFKLIPIV